MIIIFYTRIITSIDFIIQLACSKSVATTIAETQRESDFLKFLTAILVSLEFTISHGQEARRNEKKKDFLCFYEYFYHFVYSYFIVRIYVGCSPAKVYDFSIIIEEKNSFHILVSREKRP